MAAEIFAKNKRNKAAWRGLHVRLVLQSVLLAGIVPFMAVAIYLMGNRWYFFAVPYLLTWLLVGYLLNEWKCPGCQRSFLKPGQLGLTQPSRIQCVNCGLAMGEERDPAFSARGSAELRYR